MPTRIVYYAFPSGQVQGGIKMILRHVETLRDLGFNAVCQVGGQSQLPTWMTFDVPVLRREPMQADDVIVLPEDAAAGLKLVARTHHRKVVFCQNQFLLAAVGREALAGFPAENPPTVIAVGELETVSIRRLFPTFPIEVVPCFADERRFRPGEKRDGAIAYVPKKRPFEPRVVRGFFEGLYPHEAGRPWVKVHDMSEDEVAQAFGAAELYLSLSRFESVGMATLEAMASGCICAGFTGIGGRDYATEANGFWVAEDDCEGAAEALGRAADLVRTGGVSLASCLEAGRETAAQWSYARFRQALEEVWMRLAPEARLRDGPLAPGEGG